MISDEILTKFDQNQLEHVANGLINNCEIVRSHEFECAFWSTKVCAKHAY